MLLLHLEYLGPLDRFVLSKGHSAGALYICLWMQGLLSEADLDTFHQEGTRLAGHPTAGWNEAIAFSTGSLGHGLSLACGVAMGKKIRKEQGRVYCLMSDGEWQEGSTWEALIFAAHHRLHNLTLLIDLNGLQGFGSTAQVASMQNLAGRLENFGVDLQKVPGHDFKALRAAIAQKAGGPQVLVMDTIKGKGVSFMENKMEWHYLPLNQQQYDQARREVEAAQ
jgi:transketolase